MNIEQLREYCLSKPAVTEDFPFDSDTLVFRVMGKLFFLISLQNADRFNVKCDPEYAIELREKHPEIIPGYHMNKKHWNTVSLAGNLPKELILKLINHSYDLVVSSLKASEREFLNQNKPDYVGRKR